MIDRIFGDSIRFRLRRLRQEYRHRYLDTTTHKTIRATAPETELRYEVRGLGDVMMARQFVAAFSAYLREIGDPGLGTITLVAGGRMPFKPFEAGDLTLYWWYSVGPMDDQPERFLTDFFEPNIAVDPDLMLCGSHRIQREARQAGYDTLYFPIGTYGYEPLGLSRNGLGYAGSKKHKSTTKVQNLMGPFLERDDFEWVDDRTTIAELNLWYNTKLITFGLTKEGQRQWGVVNSRVFETLASSTPIILPEHPTLDDVLGFDYPYQVSDLDNLETIIQSIESNPDEALSEFAEYSELIRRDHSYFKRLETLIDAIEERQ